MKINKNLFFTYILRFIILILLIFFFRKVDFNKVKNALTHINIKYFIIATLFTFIAEFFRALKSKLYLLLYDLKTKYVNVLISEYTGCAIGLMTPGRIGEFIKISYYKIINKEKSIKQLFLIFFSLRIFDLILIFTIALISSYFLFKEIKYIHYIFYILMIFLIVFLLFILLKSSLKKLLKSISLTMFEKLNGIYKIFKTTLQKNKIKKWINFLMVFLFYWLLTFYARKFLFSSMNIQYNIFEVIKIVSIITISSIIPVAPVGIGSRELAIIGLFNFIGLSREMAILYSILIILSDGIYMLGGLILSFKIKPEIKSMESVI